MVAEDCRLSAQHVEDRDHLFSLRGRAHCQTILAQIRPKLKQSRTYSCSVRRRCRRTRPADCSPSAPWQQPGTWQLPPHCSSRCSGGAWSSPPHVQWWLPWGPLRPGEMVKVREVINVIWSWPGVRRVLQAAHYCKAALNLQQQNTATRQTRISALANVNQTDVVSGQPVWCWLKTFTARWCVMACHLATASIIRGFISIKMKGSL